MINVAIEAGIVSDLIDERRRQDQKWGRQSHPDVCPVLAGRPGGAASSRFAEDLGIPTAVDAIGHCNIRFNQSMGTWGHILVEEVAEAVEKAANSDSMGRTRDLAALRAELVQVAAVAMAWIEDLDTRTEAHNVA